jgi:hypothetical protein
MERRSATRIVQHRLPALFPVKPSGASISVDFVVGRAGDRLDARVSPRRMLAWLRSMPSYRAGVPLRLAQEPATGAELDKGAELLELLDPERPVTYQVRHPLTVKERAFLAAARPGLLVEVVVTPRGPAPGAAARHPLELVRSAVGLDPRALHWVVGPLAEGCEPEAARILEALPHRSRLSLRPLGPADLHSGVAGAPLSAEPLARLEARAHALDHTVTDFSCRAALARVGRGFPGVDRVTAQTDLARRAFDLITCADCPSRTQCHGPLDEPALLERLPRELQVVGLTLTAPPVRSGPRTFRLEVAEPTAPGDQAYLSFALGQPVTITLSTCRGEPPGGPAAWEVAPSILRRWDATGFLPVTELDATAERAREDLARRQASLGWKTGRELAVLATG